MIAQRRPILVDSVMAATHLQRAYRITVRPATIRQWAARRRFRTYSYGRRRYDLREIEDYLRKRGLLAE